MAEPTFKKSGLVIELEETGEQWDRVTEYEINDSFTIDADQWTATVFDDKEPGALRRKFLPLSRVKLYIGDKLQVVGRIKKTKGVRGSGGALQLTGYDYFADIVAPNVDTMVQVSGGMTLSEALLQGLRAYGITEIESSLDDVLHRKMGRVELVEVEPALRKARDEFERRKKLAAETGGSLVPFVGSFTPDTQAFIDALSPHLVRRVVDEPISEGKPRNGQGVLNWAQSLCSRFGLCVQPGTKRSAIAVVQPDYGKKPAFVFERGRNLIDGEASRDWSGVPTVVSFRGKFVTENAEYSDGWREISPVNSADIPFSEIDEVKRIYENAKAVDGRIPAKDLGDAEKFYCPVYHRDDDAKTEKELETSARRLLADRLRDTLQYTGYLSQVSDENDVVYPTNMMGFVIDPYEDVGEPLWIQARKIGFREGEYSELTMIRPGSYIL